MATNYLVLGQVNPASAALTTLYTTPAATQAVVSTVTVCNQSASTQQYRIAVRPDGASISPQHYLVFDSDILGNDTFAFTLGITLGDTDVISVYSNSASLSFSAFGSEIT